MSVTTKIILAGVALVIALNLAVAAIGALLGGSPGGPRASAFSTGATGAGALASLLARAGHPVELVRGRPSRTALAPDATIMLLDPSSPVAPADVAALARAVARGSVLVTAGQPGSWLRRVLPGAPVWSAAAPASLGALAPVAALSTVHRVDAPGPGSWSGGAALPLLGAGRRSLLDLADLGSGRIWLLANAAPLENRLLAKGDDAALALGLAGSSARPVLFLELYHGYGPVNGLAAVPARWWIAFAVLAVATATAMVAGGRRLGPPQLPRRVLPPPRREYVESLAGVLARTRPPGAVADLLRTRARAAVAARGGLRPDPSDAELAAAAQRLGAAPEQAHALAAGGGAADDLVALGRLLVEIRRQSPL